MRLLGWLPDCSVGDAGAMSWTAVMAAKMGLVQLVWHSSCARVETLRPPSNVFEQRCRLLRPTYAIQCLCKAEQMHAFGQAAPAFASVAHVVVVLLLLHWLAGAATRF